MTDLSYRERRAKKGSVRMRVSVAAWVILIAVTAVLLSVFVVWNVVFQSALEPDILAEDARLEATDPSVAAWPRTRATDARVTLTDCAGREVSVPEDPVSIAVFDSFSGEFAVMVGAGDRVCGVPGGVRSDVLLQELCPRLDEARAQGTMLTLSGSTINIESIISAHCDVALVKETMPDAECAKLDAASIPYVKVGYADVSGQMTAMQVVGRACGTDAVAQAERFVAYYQQTVTEVTNRAQGIAPEARMSVYHAISTALLTDAEGSLGADWIETVGCVDVSAAMAPSSGTDYQTTTEQVYDWDPDLVIANSAVAATAFREEGQWAGLRAVREGQVSAIPVGATRWGQRGSVEAYLAMLWLGCEAYPQVYADVDLEETVRAYYADLMGITITPELWEQMLAGEVRADPGNGEGSGGQNA